MKKEWIMVYNWHTAISRACKGFGVLKPLVRNTMNNDWKMIGIGVYKRLKGILKITMKNLQ
ncbi:MAG: hypothetical protein EAZ16_13985 [Sphingobacteriales bacterium]|nr:MAG: hypothetical protein EAZ16_13985 [Sphingobacteriales bacterium]